MKLRIIESNLEQAVDMIFYKFTADELKSVGIWSKGDVKKKLMLKEYKKLLI